MPSEKVEAKLQGYIVVEYHSDMITMAGPVTGRESYLEGEAHTKQEWATLLRDFITKNVVGSEGLFVEHGLYWAPLARIITIRVVLAREPGEASN